MSNRINRAIVALVLAAGAARTVSAQSVADAASAARAAKTADVVIDLRGLSGLAAVAGDARSLAGLRSLESLGSLEGLGTLESLGSLKSLASVGADARSFSSLGSLAGVAHSMRGVAEAGRAVVGVAPGLPLAAAQLSEGGFEDEQQADSLYRRAREALGAGDYKRAASLFQRVASMSKDNARASDALYYQAFALYRAGETSDLRTALESLSRLEDKYPRAAIGRDAGTLRVRVCGELAKRGDEACASDVAKRANEGGSGRVTASSQGRGCPSEDDENDERIAALNALLQMDAERAIPILERVMARRDECSAGLRRKAVFLISQKNDERSADMLLNAARNDPDKEVRGQALFWLGQTRDERAVPMLLDILNNSSDRELQEKAIFGLAQHRSDRARQALRDVAGRENAPSNVRQQAIFWLGQGRGAENGEFLRSLFSKTSDKEIKDKIIFSLSQIRDPNSAKWLLEIATGNDESLETRKQALFWAGQSKNLDIGDLDALYGRMKDREMKEQVIFVLSQRRGDDAVDKLISIAKNEPDRELRKKAIFWLSQSKDPRVAKFLEDLISK